MTGSHAEFGRLELIRESLLAVVSEMRANVIRSSYSSIIYEGHDFSCALLTADGRLVAQGDGDNPLHIFAVPYSAREILAAFPGDIHEGDIFLHNDPYTGGTHLNDVLMLYPVFLEGRLALFAAVRCHWGDVGGMTPGSLSGRVREIYQEGIRIVPTRICERGRMNQAFLELLFANMRLEHERRGDFSTMLGASRKAAEHLARLFHRFGGEHLLAGIEELIARAEAVMRRRIAAIPDGAYHAEGYMDSDGHSPEPLLARLKLTIAGDRVIADFSGTSPQTMGPINVGPAMALNAVATVIKSYLDPDTPVNHGSFNPIEIRNPPGSFLNATLPAPCGGMTECRAILAALMVSALGQALPEGLVGDLKGGANHIYISGPRPGGGDLFLLYEYPAAGTGATRATDGGHGLRTFLEGDFNAVQAVEMIEAQCPVRVERYGIRDGSCGDGRFRGGCGIVREFRVLGDGANLSVLADKNIIPPYGVASGHGGSANRFVVLRNGEIIESSPIPGKVGSFPLVRADLVCVETSGGGGHGDPLTRDPERVRQDVANGFLSTDQARRRYGVAFDAAGAVDAGGTSRERARLETGRTRVTLSEAPEDAFDGTRRMIALTRTTASAIGAAEGSLVELATPMSAASLRAWVTIDDHASDVTLGRRGLAVLGVAPGSRVEIRVVPVALA